LVCCFSGCSGPTVLIILTYILARSVPSLPGLPEKISNFCNSIYYKELSDNRFIGQIPGRASTGGIPAQLPNAALYDVSL
jgi:hypothetical protein